MILFETMQRGETNGLVTAQPSHHHYQWQNDSYLGGTPWLHECREPGPSCWDLASSAAPEQSCLHGGSISDIPVYNGQVIHNDSVMTEETPTLQDLTV